MLLGFCGCSFPIMPRRCCLAADILVSAPREMVYFFPSFRPTSLSSCPLLISNQNFKCDTITSRTQTPCVFPFLRGFFFKDFVIFNLFFFYDCLYPFFFFLKPMHVVKHDGNQFRGCFCLDLSLLRSPLCLHETSAVALAAGSSRFWGCGSQV